MLLDLLRYKHEKGTYLIVISKEVTNHTPHYKQIIPDQFPGSNVSRQEWARVRCHLSEG